MIIILILKRKVLEQIEIFHAPLVFGRARGNRPPTQLLLFRDDFPIFVTIEKHAKEVGLNTLTECVTLLGVNRSPRAH